MSLCSLAHFFQIATFIEPDAPTKISHVIHAFRRSAKKYKAKYHKPAVLILDDIGGLAKKHPNVIEDLQNIAKDVADKEEFTFIFVTSEGTIPNLMSHAC